MYDIGRIYIHIGCKSLLDVDIFHFFPKCLILSTSIQLRNEQCWRLQTNTILQKKQTINDYV